MRAQSYRHYDAGYSDIAGHIYIPSNICKALIVETAMRNNFIYNISSVCKKTLGMLKPG